MYSSEASRKRLSNWFEAAKPIETESTWEETRLAIVFGGHTYLVQADQVFQCVHCGRFDPAWSASEVLQWFDETFGIKPIEIKITCSMATS